MCRENGCEFQMKSNDLVQRTLAHFGMMTPEIRAECLACFLRDTPATDPQRQRVEQLLQTARERRDVDKC
jgi:hypothetical protein